MTTAVATPTPVLAAAADAWFDGIADPVEQALAVLRWAGDTFGDDFAITSSMADGLLAHLASRAVPGVHVVFLDTGYHFAETIGTRDWITAVLPITLRQRARRRRPSPSRTPSSAPRLYERDPDLCCSLRKVQPLAEALAGYVAWGSGVRRDESPTRAGTQDRRLGRQARHGQGQPDGRLDPGRRRRLHRRAPGAGQPAGRARLRLDRLRALHPAGRPGRGPARRPLGRPQQDRVRHPHLRPRPWTGGTRMGRMPRPPRLSPDELAAALHGLPLWSGDGDGLRRTVELPSFRDAVAAIVAIADVAEEMDHHPDIDLRWRTLHLTRGHPLRRRRDRARPRARPPDRRPALPA